MCKLIINIRYEINIINEHTFYNQAIVHHEEKVVPWGTSYLFKEHLIVGSFNH